MKFKKKDVPEAIEMQQIQSRSDKKDAKHPVRIFVFTPRGPISPRTSYDKTLEFIITWYQRLAAISVSLSSIVAGLCIADIGTGQTYISAIRTLIEEHATAHQDTAYLMLTDDDPDYSYDNCALCSETLEEQMVSNKEFLEFWNYIFLSISFLSVFVGLCAFFILSKTKPTKFLIYIVMNLLLALGDIGVITIVFLQLKQFDISNHQLLMDLSQSNHFVVTTVIIREIKKQYYLLNKKKHQQNRTQSVKRQMLMMTCLLIACSILKVITVPTSLILMFPSNPHRRSRTKSLTYRFYSSFDYRNDSLDEGGNNQEKADKLSSVSSSNLRSMSSLKKSKTEKSKSKGSQSVSSINRQGIGMHYENMADNRTKYHVSSPDYPIQVVSTLSNHPNAGYYITTPNGPNGSLLYHATPVQSINQHYSPAPVASHSRSKKAHSSAQFTKSKPNQKFRSKTQFGFQSNQAIVEESKENRNSSIAEGQSWRQTKLNYKNGLEENDIDFDHKRRPSGQRYPSLPESEKLKGRRPSRSQSSSISSDSSALYNNGQEGLFNDQTTTQTKGGATEKDNDDIKTDNGYHDSNMNTNEKKRDENGLWANGINPINISAIDLTKSMPKPEKDKPKLQQKLWSNNGNAKMNSMANINLDDDCDDDEKECEFIPENETPAQSESTPPPPADFA